MSRDEYIPGDYTCTKCEEPYDCTGCIKHSKLLKKNEELTINMGCIGCLFSIAFILISIGAGIYAIKWAWWFLKYCWNVTI